MNEVIYRPAVPEDVPAIVAIARRIWTMGMSKRLEDRFGIQAGRPWQDWVEQDIGGAVGANLERCLVAEVDGNLAGWVTWSINHARSQGQVGYNGVAPEYRGRGLGQALVQKALERIRESGVPLAIVLTGLDEGHAAARRVYEKCGFKPLHQSITYVLEFTDGQFD